MEREFAARKIRVSCAGEQLCWIWSCPWSEVAFLRSPIAHGVSGALRSRRIAMARIVGQTSTRWRIIAPTTVRVTSSPNAIRMALAKCALWASKRDARCVDARRSRRSTSGD